MRYYFIILLLLLSGCVQHAPARETTTLEIQSIHSLDQFYKIDAEYPQFTGADAIFNENIAQTVLQQIETFKQESKDNYEARRATSNETLPETPEVPFDFVAKWHPIQINDRYLSFFIEIYYFSGGAHGATQIYTFNYDMLRGKEMGISDVVGTSDLTQLAQLSKDSVKAQLVSEGMNVSGFLEQMVDMGTNATQQNYNSFTFGYDTLSIYFQRYQVAPGYVGPVTIDLRQTDLTAYGMSSAALRP